MTIEGPRAGDVIDQRYRVERLIGGGGMGVVVVARHLRVGHQVAIKFPRAALAQRRDVVERLLREARVMMRIQSEHVARVYDAGSHASFGPYLVMEYLAGQDLGAVLSATGALPFATAVSHALQACEAVAEAHALGIVHRDLKPSNLFLARRPDGTSAIKVIDFGLAKCVDAEELSALTDSGATLGSPLYMAPEQMRGRAEVGVSADIWALGATLVALVSGKAPFPGRNLLDVYDAIQAGPPKLAPRGVAVAQDEPLQRVIDRCLRLRPDERYADIGELALDLARIEPQAGASAERACRILKAAREMVPTRIAATQGELDTAVTLPPSALSLDEVSSLSQSELPLAMSATHDLASPRLTRLRRLSMTAVLIAIPAIAGLWFYSESARPSSSVNHGAPSAKLVIPQNPSAAAQPNVSAVAPTESRPSPPVRPAETKVDRAVRARSRSPLVSAQPTSIPTRIDPLADPD